MHWVERVLAAASTFKEVSLTLSCPFHCGPSILPAFVLGILCGLILGILLAVYLIHFLWISHTVPHPHSHQPADPSTGTRAVKRISGYLHERRGS